MAFERISLNIIPYGEMPVFHVSQFDVGRPIIIDLYNGDDAYTPAAGVTFELHCRKVDDNIVTLDTYEVDQNTITFASTEQLCACSGDNLCEVSILLDDLVMGTLNFILHVERDPLAGGCTSETSIYNLQQQIDDIITGEGYVKDTDLEVLQSDWDETDPTSPAYIKNKPGPSLVDQADWTETDPTKQSYIKHKPDLKTVATTGSYNDLTDKPTIPAAQVQSDWAEADNTKVDYIKNKPDLSIYAQSSDLATVATSGDYDDLTNKPTIPAAQIQSDWNQTDNTAKDFIKNKPWVPVYTENETPYQIRTAPANNNRCLEKLVGVSCAFNQLVNTGDTSINTTSGRKYLTKINNVWSIIQGGSAVTIVDDSSDMVIDLTACFGSEVADYLYTLESNTAGSGIALFKQLFPEDYYTYQTATLISSKPVAKKVVGKNLYNGSQSITLSGEGSTAKQTCKLLIGSYTLSLTSSTSIAFAVYTFDENNNQLEVFSSLGSTVGRTYLNITVTKPCSTIAWYINASTTITDIQVELGSSMTVFAPYEEHTYPLGSDELRGLLKVENGNLVAFGDVHNSDGTGTKYFEERAYVSGDESLPNAITDGTNTVVALTTPTPTTYTHFTNPMISGSTEEFTDSRSLKMFCGHDSLYYSSPFKGW